MANNQIEFGRTRSTGLVEVLDRILDKGLFVGGDIRISLAEVELLTIRIRLIVCSLLLAIVVMFGFLCFFFPGVVLLCGLLLAFPALVLEPGTSPLAALSRSWWLTRGSRWRMLGLLVTLFILLYVPIIAIAALITLFLPAGGGTQTHDVATLAVVGVLQMLLYPLLYCVLTVAYYDLRVRKEGFDLEVLASTLQPA